MRPLVFATIPKLRLRLITVDLEPDKYCDVQGNKIYGSVILELFESVIGVFLTVCNASWRWALESPGHRHANLTGHRRPAWM